MKKNINSILSNSDAKRDYNKALFNVVAPRYDLITKLLSVGRDYWWKKRLVALLPEFTGPLCVDIACGTGDVAALLARKYSQGTVVGIDLTPAMIERARARHTAHNLSFVEGDMANLAFADCSQDIVSGSYALRNAPDLDRALSEVARILRPGGMAAFLDFSKSSNKYIGKIQYGLLKLWGCLWGVLMHGDASVYGYIADSLALFPDAYAFSHKLESHGFKIIDDTYYMGGLVRIVMCEKKR